MHPVKSLHELVNRQSIEYNGCCSRIREKCTFPRILTNAATDCSRIRENADVPSREESSFEGH